MYKHECVVCSKEHGHKCILAISFYDRFMGNDSVIFCMEYVKRMEKLKKVKNK
jgi:hypothetical protein